MEERRKATRLPFESRLALVISETGHAINVRGFDVSDGGLGVITRIRVEPGTACRLRFRLPAGHATHATTIEPSAEVVRTTPLGEDEYLLGIAFAYIPPLQASALREFIDDCLSRTTGETRARA